ncbi:MAG: DUF3365 domain-containing protein [Sulfurisoma sp.]|nr:DUF3365 domain-containing protein [Sulfurisoma sp.]
MRKTLIAAAFAAVSVSAIAQEGNLLQDVRQTAMSMPPKLLEVLDAEIKKSGHAEAMVVCRDKAPAMAKALSEAKGMQIRRVSLKNRNPKATPDAWEKKILEDFEKRTAGGEKPGVLEASEIVMEDGKRVMRYMKALPTQDLCLACHGTDDRIDKDVKAKLKELYPDDKAVGYSAAQIRGAITVRKPL